MLLVSFINLNIWASYGQKMVCMPYLGTRFLAKTQHFWANWAEFFMGVQETIIYRLVMRNLSCNAYFWILIFWVTGGPRSWPTRWTFWANRYLESCFRNFQGRTLSPLLWGIIFKKKNHFQSFRWLNFTSNCQRKPLGTWFWNQSEAETV